MKTYLNETLRNSKEYDWKETKMIKNIKSYFYYYCYFRFIVICMYIDVTLGRKMEAGKTCRQSMRLIIVIFNYM